MKKDYREIEETIESRIEELEKDYELDANDIEEIRVEAYEEGGWTHDPFPETETEDDDDEDDDDEAYRIDQELKAVGMSWADFI